jgi:hypothetical protein
MNTNADVRERYRWLGHLGLIVSFLAALAALLLRSSITIHIIVGLVFVAFVIVHIAQRRRTTSKLAAQLVHLRSWSKPRGRLGLSDAVLAFLTLNVLVSGVVDWASGRNTPFPLRELTGLPIHFIGWHGLSSVVLLCYLLVHVLRRRTRLRRSQIR